MAVDNITEHPILAAVRYIGSQNKLAKALGIYQSTVSKWIHFNRPITSRLVIKIEEITDGKVTRHQLRPDLYPEN